MGLAMVYVRLSAGQNEGIGWDALARMARVASLTVAMEERCVDEPERPGVFLIFWFRAHASCRGFNDYRNHQPTPKSTSKFKPHSPKVPKYSQRSA